MVPHEVRDLSSFLLGVDTHDAVKLIGPIIGYGTYAACFVRGALSVR